MKILFHICCAPCAIAPIKALKAENHEIIGYWFNPNIHPYCEWQARLESVRKLAQIENLRIIYEEDYDIISSLKSLMENPAPKIRCEKCYEIRFEKTARIAMENECEAFTTSLLYSKYQLHEVITDKARSISEKIRVPFFYRDFRKLWGKGLDTSRKEGLYRQRWCGCIFSEVERLAR